MKKTAVMIAVLAALFALACGGSALRVPPSAVDFHMVAECSVERSVVTVRRRLKTVMEIATPKGAAAREEGWGNT